MMVYVLSEDESRDSDSAGEFDYGNQVDVEGPASETNNLKGTSTSSKPKGGLGEQTKDFVEIECNMSEQILRSLCDSDSEGAVHRPINVFEERNLKKEHFKFVIGMVFSYSTEFKWAVQYHEAMRQKDVMFKKNEARRVRVQEPDSQGVPKPNSHVTENNDLQDQFQDVVVETQVPEFVLNEMFCIVLASMVSLSLPSKVLPSSLDNQNHISSMLEKQLQFNAGNK
nr:Zinc knuckle family protein [Ipomoea batatas]